MERKGSGFGKIISGYEFQIKYNESKKPSFSSDSYQFTVVMPNLNYDVPQDFEGNETMSESMSESMSELERTRMQIILHYLETNREKISSIAEKLLKVEIKTASRLLLKAEKLDILKSYEKKIKYILENNKNVPRFVEISFWTNSPMQYWFS